jgi:hypothetical protein
VKDNIVLNLMYLIFSIHLSEAYSFRISLCSFLIDFLLAIASLADGLYIWITIGAQLADQYIWLASFEFFILPIIFIVTLIVVCYQRWTCGKRPDPYPEELAPAP